MICSLSCLYSASHSDALQTGIYASILQCPIRIMSTIRIMKIGPHPRTSALSAVKIPSYKVDMRGEGAPTPYPVNSEIGNWKLEIRIRHLRNQISDFRFHIYSISGVTSPRWSLIHMQPGGPRRNPANAEKQADRPWRPNAVVLRENLNCDCLVLRSFRSRFRSGTHSTPSSTLLRDLALC
jgi:hypothetical protein